MKKIVIALAVLAGSLSAWSHSGGTDKMGCHTDHKTGLWHCH